MDETIEFLKTTDKDLSKTIILVNGPEVIEKLIEGGIKVQNINVGGMHFREGRKNYLPYLYISEKEINSFQRCMAKGVNFECLDVPTGNKVNLKNEGISFNLFIYSICCINTSALLYLDEKGTRYCPYS